MENITIRELKTTDADDIGAIFADITQKTVTPDFKNLIEKELSGE